MTTKILKAYVTAIQNAGIHRGTALNIEMSVGLAVFESGGKKSDLMACYAEAGYHCATDGSDYKTVNRRVNAAWRLFKHVGKEQVATWAEGRSYAAKLTAIQDGLEPLAIKTITDINVLTGHIAKQVMKKSREFLGGHHVKTEHMDVYVPADATREELVQAAEALLKMAETIAAASVGALATHEAEGATVQ